MNIRNAVTQILPYMDQSALYNQTDQSVALVAGLTAYTGQASYAQNVALSASIIPGFMCPSSAAANSVDAYAIPANALAPTVPPQAITWNGGRMDYVGTSGILGVAAGLAQPSGVTGQRGGMFVVATGPPYGTGAMTRFRDITDGLSNTFMLAEMTGGNTIYIKTAVAPAAYQALALGNGGSWVDPLIFENWLGGSLAAGPSAQGPCLINCNNVRGKNYHSFHTGGCHFLMGDGAVKFISENISAVTLGALITSSKGEVVGEF